MKKRYVFDIDGVIRDLHLALRIKYNIPILTEWHSKKYNVCKLINKDLSLLEDAPSTKYLSTIAKYKDLEFWSHQPNLWQKYTENWLERFLGEAKYRVYYLSPEEKFRTLQGNSNIFLIDDYPLFPNYNRIILVDQPYNQETKANVRVKTKQELKDILKI
jgi:FMN phosphatase YigB (HAD superfamily)